MPSYTVSLLGYALYLGWDRSLLYSLVQLPVRVFSEEAVSIASLCWQWVVTARPTLEYHVRKVGIKWPWLGMYACMFGDLQV